MQIKKLKIENFRGIREMELEFHPKMNVFIGVNGAGKSSVLDMLAILFSHSRVFSDNQSLNLRQNDICQGSDAVVGQLKCSAVDTRVCVDLNYAADEIKARTSYDEPNRLEELRKAISVEKDLGYNYPIAVFYPINRTIQKAGNFTLRPATSQLHALKGALSVSLDFQSFFDRCSQVAKHFSDIDEEIEDTDFSMAWYKSQVSVHGV